MDSVYNCYTWIMMCGTGAWEACGRTREWWLWSSVHVGHAEAGQDLCENNDILSSLHTYVELCCMCGDRGMYSRERHSNSGWCARVHTVHWARWQPRRQLYWRDRDRRPGTLAAIIVLNRQNLPQVMERWYRESSLFPGVFSCRQTIRSTSRSIDGKPRVV